jgi:hypothetical protein
MLVTCRLAASFLRVAFRILRWPAFRLRRRTHWHHPREPDERTHRPQPDKQPKGCGRALIDSKGHAEGPSRQSSHHGNVQILLQREQPTLESTGRDHGKERTELWLANVPRPSFVSSFRMPTE